MLQSSLFVFYIVGLMMYAVQLTGCQFLVTLLSCTVVFAKAVFCHQFFFSVYVDDFIGQLRASGYGIAYILVAFSVDAYCMLMI